MTPRPMQPQEGNIAKRMTVAGWVFLAIFIVGAIAHGVTAGDAAVFVAATVYFVGADIVRALSPSTSREGE